MIKAKYVHGPWKTNSFCSRTWAACKAANPLVEKRLRRIVKNGESDFFGEITGLSKGLFMSHNFGLFNKGKMTSM